MTETRGRRSPVTPRLPIWRPSEARKTASNLASFIGLASERTGLRFDDYGALYRWSVARPEEFWPLMWEFGDIRASRTWDQVLESLAQDTSPRPADDISNTQKLDLHER